MNSGNRWKGGQSIKLEGSDHAPVFVTLMEIPEIPLHSTPSLSARYVPMVRGVQQTLGTLKHFFYLRVRVFVCKISIFMFLNFLLQCHC
jgi:hypothetical protein